MYNNLKTLINKFDLPYKEYSKLIVGRWHNSVPYHTSIDIKTKEVYNIYDGVVIDISTDGKYQIVNVQINYDDVIRYGHLTSVVASIGSAVSVGDMIGTTSDIVAVEYCNTNNTNNKSNSFPVHIGSMTYYKYDPTDVVINDVTFNTVCTMYEYINYKNRESGQ